MTQQDLLDQILLDTYTQADALRRLSSLKEVVVAKLFGSRENAEAQIPTAENLWLQVLNPDTFRYFNKDNVYRTFETLEKVIKDVKPLVIYLPFELPESELAAIGTYLRKDYGKNFLVEIKFDPGLIAGTALVWSGIYKDYSIRQKIAENREKILSTMKEFIHK